MIFECTAVRQLSGSKSDRHVGFVCPAKDIVETKLRLSHPSSDSQASQPPMNSRIGNNYNSYLESTESWVPVRVLYNTSNDVTES